MNKTRLEAFSDGVFAIIITIMVLELKIPEGTSWDAVKPVLSPLGSYVLSFVFVGIYWGNHHHIMHTLKKVNGGIMWANMHLLFWLSLIPLATGWMGKTNFDRVAVAVYGALLIICGISFTILSTLICRTYTEHTKLSKAIAKTNTKGIWSVILYTSAVILALFVHPALAAILYISVSIMWIIPSKEIETALNEEGDD